MVKKEGWRSTISLRVSPLVVDIEPRSTALLVIDMQNLSCSPEAGVIPTISKLFPKEAAYIQNRISNMVIPNIQKLLKFFRDNKLKVFYCQMGSRMADGSDLYTLRKIGDAETQERTGTHFIYGPGTFPYDIVKELKPVPGEISINKRTRSVFVGTELDHMLRMIGIDSLVITGGWTDVCVQASAFNAIDLGYKGILIDDATATISQEYQDNTMRLFESFFSKVMDTDEVIAMLSRKLKI